MTVGTKSVLYGAHQFLFHPLCLVIAWWKLYGFPWDPRLWVAFFVHDLGYIGKPNMDGPEGETHVLLGAKIMHWLFDWGYVPVKRPVCHCGEYCDKHDGYWSNHSPVPMEMVEPNFYWHDFCLYHSRFYARRDKAQISRLCVADKLAITLVPTWLLVFYTRLTGELDEYMQGSLKSREGNKCESSNIYHPDPCRWYDNVKRHLRLWVKEHSDGRPEGWLPPIKGNS